MSTLMKKYIWKAYNNFKSIQLISSTMTYIFL